MTEQPKEYIITEDELDTLDNMDQNDFVRDLLERVRSRPVIISPEGAAPEPDYSRHNPRIELRKVCEQEAHDAAIRQDEREKALPLVKAARETQAELFRVCWDKNLIELVKQLGSDLRAIEGSLQKREVPE